MHCMMNLYYTGRLGTLSLGFPVWFVVNCSDLRLDHRGVEDWLWFGPQWSNRPGVLCTGPQDTILQSSGGFVVVNWAILV